MSEDEKNIHSIDNLDGSDEPSSATIDGAGELQQALDAKTDECKAANEKYLRLAAEFDNHKWLAAWRFVPPGVHSYP